MPANGEGDSRTSSSSGEGVIHSDECMAAINCRFTGNLSKRVVASGRAGRGRRGAVCVTDHGGAGGLRPAAFVKRGRRIRRTPRLKAIRPPGGRADDWPATVTDSQSRARPARPPGADSGLPAHTARDSALTRTDARLLGRVHDGGAPRAHPGGASRARGARTRRRRTRLHRTAAHRVGARAGRADATAAAADVVLQRCASRDRLRDAGGERRRRAPGALPVVAPGGAPQRRRAGALRGRAQGPRGRRLPRGTPPRALLDSGAAPVSALESREAAGPVARSALPGGGTAPRPTPGSRRQIQSAQEVSSASDHLGRRAEDSLFQGEDAVPAAGVVSAGSVPEPHQEEGAGGGDGPHADPSGKLVQEPAAAGPRGGRQEPVGRPRQRVRLLLHVRRGLGRLGDQRRRRVTRRTV
ncbi:unnamed protein product [Leptosia nina]|uniref:Uncharacterized protein n=1 Tax=Leptosia nina TaxID=320188 RepID=A0AAV1IXC5_9NEOP